MKDHVASSPRSAALTRTSAYFGAQGMDRLRAATVAVFGLGGVGSHAACALVRNGIGGVRLVDFDTVTASSLNRHAIATPSDVGKPKTQVLADALAHLDATVRLDCRQAFFGRESRAQLLEPPLSFVIDAIDSVGPKVELLCACVAANLPVISCLGAAGRIRGESVQLADIFDSHTCPLARMIRKRLHQQGVHAAIPAIFSPELPCPPLPPDDGEPYLRRGRRRRQLPSVGVVPGIVGYAAAGYVLRTLAAHSDDRTANLR
jgi:tRNA A37 threonylcarbamoyladenosine dehydratase